MVSGLPRRSRRQRRRLSSVLGATVAVAVRGQTCGEEAYFCASSGKCVAKDASCLHVEEAEPSCGLEMHGASFDLSGLRKTDDYAVAVEKTTTVLQFGVCSDAATPAACLDDEATPGAAFAVTNDETCARVGGSILSVTTRPLNASDPTRGLALTYGAADDGDRCENTHYALTLELRCWPPAVDDDEVRTASQDDCRFFVEMRTAAACPLQCERGGSKGEPCSGSGDCVYDPVHGARCDCHGDAAGAACDRHREKSDEWIWTSTAVVAVVFLGAAYAILHRCRALRRARANEIDLYNHYVRYRSVADEDDGLELMRDSSARFVDDDDDRSDDGRGGKPVYLQL